MAALLRRLSLRTSSSTSPKVVVTTCRKAADVLMATTTTASPKSIENMEKSLDNLHILLFEAPYSPKGGAETHKSSSSTSSTNGATQTNTNTNDTPTTTNPITTTLVTLIVSEEIDLFLSVVLIIKHLNFEHRKLVAILFNHFYRSEESFRNYVVSKIPLLDFIFSGYSPEQRDVCINLHSIAHNCIKKDKRIAEWFLNSRHLPLMFSNYCMSGDFEVQSKAFTIFSTTLKLYPKTTANFIKKNPNEFFDAYNTTLKQGNYVVQVQFLKLLGELLVVRKFRKIMAIYVNRKENLMPIMKLLRAKSNNIQFEAFHVFKIFVANPNKEERVEYVFKSNVQKLIKFMNKFLNDKCTEDEDLYDERNTVIETLKEMEMEKTKEENKNQEQEETKEGGKSVLPLPLPLPLP